MGNLPRLAPQILLFRYLTKLEVLFIISLEVLELGDEERGLLNYQEDEIARKAHRLRESQFYSDLTPSLTDETFEKIVNGSTLSLVFFYIPNLDDVSYLTQPIIDEVRQTVDAAADIDAKVGKTFF